MVCPKCGFNGNDGLECQRCGVIVDKYAKRGFGSPNQGPEIANATLNRLPASRNRERPKKPIGHTLVWGFLLITVAVGVGILFDYMRLHLQGNKVYKVLRAALVPKDYSGSLMTADRVLDRIMAAAREEGLDLPANRVYVKIWSNPGEQGEVLTVTLKVHLPTKIGGVIKFPIFREVDQKFPTRALTSGFSQYEPDPKSALAQDIAAFALPKGK